MDARGQFGEGAATQVNRNHVNGGRKMRDPNRIHKVLDYVRRVWERNPDLRLGQLIVNLTSERFADLFYVEDEQLLDVLRRELDIYER